MDKIVQNLDLDVKDEVAKLENEVLNPDNNLHAPIVKVVVDGAEVVNDADSLLHKVENGVEDVVDKLEMPIGFPGHGV